MLASIVGLAVVVGVVGAPDPTHRSVDHFAVANGIGSAAVRLSDGRLDSFRPHIYAALDDGIATPELAFDAYFAVRAQGVSVLLTDIPIDAIAAVDDADAVTITQHVVDGAGATLRIETTTIGPFAIDRAAVVAVVKVTNESAAPASSLSFPTIAN